MKKRIIITVAVSLVVVLSLVSYLYIWGGTPQIENFDEISRDYEIIANLALGYSSEASDEIGHATLFNYDGYMEVNDARIDLNEEQKAALKTVNKQFGDGCLWVTEDAVIFWHDETKEYGLVYSESPLSTIRDMKSDWYKGLEYHRINSNWYEIGVWGI